MPLFAKIRHALLLSEEAMALFGRGSSPKARLATKWYAYYTDIREHEERIRVREAELRSILTGTDAFNRAVLEVFCDDRLFLPVDGLDGIGEYLLEQGFYWGHNDSQTARVLFPDGWRLVPSELNQERDSLYTATLVGPDEKAVATIRYCGYPYLASMRGLS